MRFILTIIVLTISDLSLLWYLVNLEYFSPFNFKGDIDNWNIIFFIFLVSSGVSLIASLVEYLFEYFLYCGRKEFPKIYRPIKVGLGFFIATFILLILHIFHFLSIGAGLAVAVILIIGIILIR